VSAVPEEMHLAAESIEALAVKLAELLGEPSSLSRDPEDRMLSAAEVARRWGISRRWIYDHAGDLGAMRMGGGPRPRLRFDPVEVGSGHRGRPIGRGLRMCGDLLGLPKGEDPTRSPRRPELVSWKVGSRRAATAVDVG
jgi:hypothetical protein